MVNPGRTGPPGSARPEMSEPQETKISDQVSLGLLPPEEEERPDFEDQPNQAVLCPLKATVCVCGLENTTRSWPQIKANR